MATQEDLRTPQIVDLDRSRDYDIIPTFALTELSQAQQSQLAAVQQLITSGEKIRARRFDDAESGLAWSYYEDEMVHQGTLYAKFGPKGNGLIGVTFEGKLGSQSFIKAEAYWQDKSGSKKGLIILSSPDVSITENRSALFYSQNNEGALQLDVFGDFEQWFLAGLSEGDIDESVMLDYYDRNPVLIGREIQEELLRDRKMSAVHFYLRD